MKVQISVILALIIVIVYPGTVGAYLGRNLNIGDQGPDVLELQKTLNNLGILVANTGPGSPGQETDFFGDLTARAVAKYQERYADAILTPLGLVRGTGFLGVATRFHMNNLSVSKGFSAPETEVSTPAEQVFVAPPPGGQAKTDKPSNNVSAPSSVEVEAVPVDPGSIAGFDFPPPPKRSTTMNIFSISPTSGTFGTRVKLVGEGFAKSGNKVYTGHDLLNNVSSTNSGKQIEFTIANTFTDANFDEIDYQVGQNHITLGIYVENDTGISNPIYFQLNLE